MAKLEEMVSAQVYEEIEKKVSGVFGEETAKFLFPAVKKALEEGSGEIRENILGNWLDCDYCRVCSHCGEIMEEGWYLGPDGYACSDECCKELMGIDKDEFDRYRIYLPEIKEYLEREGEGRNPEDLTKEEIDGLTRSFVDGQDAYFYTQWC